MEASSVRRPGRTLDPARRAAILTAARAVFLREGFAAGTMDAVADEARVGKQTVYRHFGSKEALIMALVKEMCAVAAPSLPEQSSERDRVRAMLDLTVTGLTSPESISLYRAILAEVERMPELAILFWSSGPLLLRQALADVLAASVPQNRAEKLASRMIQIALGDAYQELLLGVRPGDDHAFREQIDAALDLLA